METLVPIMLPGLIKVWVLALELMSGIQAPSCRDSESGCICTCGSACRDGRRADSVFIVSGNVYEDAVILIEDFTS